MPLSDTTCRRAHECFCVEAVDLTGLASTGPAPIHGVVAGPASAALGRSRPFQLAARATAPDSAEASETEREKESWREPERRVSSEDSLAQDCRVVGGGLCPGGGGGGKPEAAATAPEGGGRARTVLDSDLALGDLQKLPMATEVVAQHSGLDRGTSNFHPRPCGRKRPCTLVANSSYNVLRRTRQHPNKNKDKGACQPSVCVSCHLHVHRMFAASKASFRIGPLLGSKPLTQQQPLPNSSYHGRHCFRHDPHRHPGWGYRSCCADASDSSESLACKSRADDYVVGDRAPDTTSQ